MNYLFLKNIFDRFFALLALFVLSPILIILIFLVKKNFGKNVFFKQIRPGYKSKLFTLIKFRTMNNNLDQFGNVINKSNNSGRPDNNVPAAQSHEFKDYEFTIENISPFTKFQIKIDMVGTNQAQPPFIKDLRAIALA